MLWVKGCGGSELRVRGTGRGSDKGAGRGADMVEVLRVLGVGGEVEGRGTGLEVET